MVLMSSSRGRTDGKSNYWYVVGNDELAQLVSRVQATAIRIGHELEDMIASRSDTSITMERI
ncbi:hypothetical protein [Nitrosococcus oceani]|uniref:Uncharacterized protein n=1 Tax=Nitrosococcus oceani C-27 TaxID=314279 RepID=A0A0E2Z4H9_9GAMM|nr:hypothetical protein [Nitrosococcus oceani]KFI20613.1 hypothetical protein IB75_02155 [Nitrosococcus oceani C-27]GEM20862.1 hypothetical protein NONS58_22850 [Nitrosococcus oceani]